MYKAEQVLEGLHMNVDFPLVVDEQTFRAWHNMILSLLYIAGKVQIF